MGSGISIGSDSTIYFISTLNKNGLFAVRPDGSIKWVLKDIINNVEIHTTPLIARDGTIYVGGGLTGKLYAVDTDGTKKWELKTLGSIFQVGLNIGLDGTIYLLNSDSPTTKAKLTAVNPKGFIEWYYENENINYSSPTGNAISPDGRTIYVPGINPSILAIDLQTRTLKWAFGQSRFDCTPTVDSDGNIYLLSRSDTLNSGKPSLFCLRPDGSVKWSFMHGNRIFSNTRTYFREGTIDKYGNYYFALDTLYSLDYYGNLRWKLGLNGISWGSLLTDKDGNIYLSVYAEAKYISVSNDGNLLWTVNLDNDFTGFSPALGYNNQIYYPSFKSDYVVCIK
jgi:outer membrane protein assembly factor BamB